MQARNPQRCYDNRNEINWQPSNLYITERPMGINNCNIYQNQSKRGMAPVVAM